MRIFVIGAATTGRLLAQSLARQGHTVWCGDRDPERARRFLGKKSTIPVTEVNARNQRGIVKAAKGCQLIVNASASVFNENVLRAALRLRAHYLDLSSHLTRHPFKAEQFRYAKKFEKKNRAALINAGVAPGLTNLLVKRAAELLDEVEAVHIRLYESSESDDPISQWSPLVSCDEAVSHPRVYRGGKFQLGKRFSEVEKFRFAEPIGASHVVLAAQDEVATLPHFIPMQGLDVKIGGNEIDRLRRWHRLGKLSKSRGKKDDQRLLIRSDCTFPTLYQIRQQGRYTTPVAYATAHIAALFIKFFPRDPAGVFAPEMLPAETRRSILAGIRNNSIRITHKTIVQKHHGEEDEEF